MISSRQEAALRSRRAFPVRGLARRAADFHWLCLILPIAYVVIPGGEVRDLVSMAAVQVLYAGYILVAHYRDGSRKTSVTSLLLDTWAMIAYIAFMMWQAGGHAAALIPLFLIPAVVSAIGHTRRLALFHVVLMCSLMLLLQWPELNQQNAARIVSELFVYGFLLAMIATLVGGFKLDNLLASGQLRRLMDRDELTGLLNMPAFNRLGSQVHQRSRRNGEPLSLMIVDIQNLNAVNDAHGMEAGNQVIRSVGGVISRMVRDTDIAARFGGDEFILMLPSADRVKAEEIGQRLRNGVNQTTLELRGIVKKVSVNIGVSTYPRDGEALSELVQEANRAMYRDKELRRPKAKG